MRSPNTLENEKRVVLANFGDSPAKIAYNLIRTNLVGAGGLDNELITLDDKLRLAFRPSSALFDFETNHWRVFVPEPVAHPSITFLPAHRPILTVFDNKFLEVISQNGHNSTRYASMDGKFAGSLPYILSSEFYNQFQARETGVNPWLLDKTQVSPLTPRETQVLQARINGLNDKEIAAELKIPLNTVMTHLKNGAWKIKTPGDQGSVYVAVTAIRNNWVQIPQDSPPHYLNP